MQKTVNEDVPIYSNAALVLKKYVNFFFSQVASWNQVTVLKIDLQ